jgi:hypothetical protein
LEFDQLFFAKVSPWVVLCATIFSIKIKGCNSAKTGAVASFRRLFLVRKIFFKTVEKNFAPYRFGSDRQKREDTAMTDIQADRKADVAKVEQHDQPASASKPKFDVITLFKEGAQGVGAVAKDIVGGVSTAAKDVGDFLDIPELLNAIAPPPSAEAAKTAAPVQSGYDYSHDPTEQNCEGDIGVALMIPAGIGGMLAGVKLGIEAGFLVGGPAGMSVGVGIGMVGGFSLGVGAAFYSSHEACTWMAGLDQQNQQQRYHDFVVNGTNDN